LSSFSFLFSKLSSQHPTEKEEASVSNQATRAEETPAVGLEESKHNTELIKDEGSYGTELRKQETKAGQALESLQAEEKEKIRPILEL